MYEAGTFGKCLKVIRRAAKISQKELGRRVGMSQSTIAAYEVGKIDPNSKALVVIAEELNCTCDQLLGRAEIKVQ